MEGFNSCQFVGHIGQDPEIRYTQSGKGVMNLRIACGRRYLDSEGTPQERTEWVPLVIWGKRAEGLAKVLTKGSRIHATGEFTTRNWVDKNGNKRSTSEINVRSVLLLSVKGQQVEAPPPSDEDLADS